MMSALLQVWCSLFIFSVADSGSTGTPQSTVASSPAPSAPNFGSTIFDSGLTDQARIYAGMMPLNPLHYSNLTSTNAWQQHRKIFEDNWTKLNRRLQAMSVWRDSALAGISMDGATLFYPFSGPDFLNADIFFPECEKSVYLSLEGAGSIPSTDMSEAHLNSFLEDIRAAMAEIFERNYFITSYMNKDFYTPYLKGNLTAFMIFLARRNCAIVSIEKIHIDSAGKLVNAPADTGIAGRKDISGIEIQYITEKKGSVHSLFYFPVDIQDKSLKLKPQFQTFLGTMSDMITFTKAASYCMHGSDFSIIRGICLRAKAVLEDDTGIPYRFFKQNEWEVSFYGRYTKPVKDFHYGFQADLDSAYRFGKNVKPLPYSIGYHWRDGFSSFILAIRKGMQ
jgi:hypothetical protein